ncbi:uncharacterized protein LOC113372402 isoform X2 [Ctenocephalides felis]|uniref:uncharacterized protein LOC113372402 isoform X2 n=1 Tax=Ctenocephalides felis TaxID=7515 RepID=UPI000E6E5792|nr:uncharacterized protein LOC113372402 isoform X2 [Ctenocephalides felis]
MEGIVYGSLPTGLVVTSTSPARHRCATSITASCDATNVCDDPETKGGFIKSDTFNNKSDFNLRQNPHNGSPLPSDLDKIFGTSPEKMIVSPDVFDDFTAFASDGEVQKPVSLSSTNDDVPGNSDFTISHNPQKLPNSNGSPLPFDKIFGTSPEKMVVSPDVFDDFTAFPSDGEVQKTVSSSSTNDDVPGDKDEGTKSLHVQFLNGQRDTTGETLASDGKSIGSPITPLNSSNATSASSSSTSSSSSSDEDESSSSTLSSEYTHAGISTKRPQPPDGGWGWVVVAAAFCVNLIADGISFSFGVMFVDFLEYFGDNKSTTAWIGSLFMGMPLLSGPVASFLTDRYGCRRVTIVGAILAAAGFALSSQANSIMALLFTFGILAGFGLSLCYVAAVVIVAYYFDKKRSFATGLSVCGSGIGTFLFAPLTQALLDEYGWRGTTLILSGLFLNMAVCGALMRDLPWTADLARAKARDRKRARRRLRAIGVKQRKNKKKIKGGSSAESFTASNSTNTYSQLQSLAINNGLVTTIGEEDETEDREDHKGDLMSKSAPVRPLFSSLVNLPTYVLNNTGNISNGDLDHQAALDIILARNKDFYLVSQQGDKGVKDLEDIFAARSKDAAVLDLLLQRNEQLAPSKSFSDSGRLDNIGRSEDIKKDINDLESPPPAAAANAKTANGRLFRKNQNGLIPNQGATNPVLDNSANKRLQASYLKDLRVHRHSLTYRGAMLNINRYRLRASSCPDIYRNSMTTIAKEQYDNWPWDGLWEFWDLLRDMLDLSHFADARYVSFALSNFLLYTWYDVMYIYLADNAIGMGVSQTDASVLLSVIGILNMVGEIILGWAGDLQCLNAGLVYALCMGLCGAATAMVPLMNSYLGLCIASGAFGLFIAANYALTSIILVELITLERFTNAYGLLLLVQGVANLIGPPLAGWIGDITEITEEIDL